MTLIYGKGLYSKDEAFNETLQKLIPQEETKRVAFDLKLFGNAAYQVYWNDAHTQIIKMYHIPVQYLRAEKIYQNPKVENYYYCTDDRDLVFIQKPHKVHTSNSTNLVKPAGLLTPELKCLQTANVFESAPVIMPVPQAIPKYQRPFPAP